MMHQDGYYQAKCPKCGEKLTTAARSPNTKRQCPFCGYRYAPLKRKVKK